MYALYCFPELPLNNLLAGSFICFGLAFNHLNLIRTL